MTPKASRELGSDGGTIGPFYLAVNFLCRYFKYFGKHYSDNVGSTGVLSSHNQQQLCED